METSAVIILVTDYAWEDLEIERTILQRIGATLVPAKEGSENELIGLAKHVDGILTNWKSVTQRVIENAGKCKAIGRYGVGLDNIDVRCATAAGIVVTNVPAYCLEEVAEHAMALLLSLARKVTFFDRAIKGGRYDLASGTPLFRIKGKTLGIIGFGGIGRRMAKKAAAFGLRVLVSSRRANPNSGLAPSIECAGFAEVLGSSDFISVHLPLTTETHHLFGYETFRQMKRTAFFINTARGAVIDPASLLRALDDGLIAGAGLDVFATEPPDPDDPLILHPRVVATPHAGFNSVESLESLRTTAAEQMVELFSGRVPQFVVNPGVLKQSNLRIALHSIPPAGH
jgi:D-3-phosphoglycerate dehydrogenase